MKRWLCAFVVLTLLLSWPASAEEEAPAGEVTFELDGGENEPESEPIAYVDDTPVGSGDASDYIIPYPDVTSKEIREQLTPSDRVYPGLLLWPLPGTPVLRHITSHVGWRNAARIHNSQGGTWPSWLHHGIDVGGVTTKQPIVAAAGGLAYAGQRRGYGKYVVIDHQNGWYTEYQHLSAFAGAITKGCRGVSVEAGDMLGYVGNSGGNYPVHFHFEIAWSPKGAGSDDKKYFKALKSRTIHAYSFAQSAVVELHWPRTWKLCTAEKQRFVGSVEELKNAIKDQ